MSKIIFLLLFSFLSLNVFTQNYIGVDKIQIMLLMLDQKPIKVIHDREYRYHDSLEVLIYNFNDKTCYYYIDPKTKVCVSQAMLFNSSTAKDSLSLFFNEHFYPLKEILDTTSNSWLQFDENFDFKYILRDFKPPLCLIIIPIPKNIYY